MKTQCKIFGHKIQYCENGCKTHGSCERCFAYWDNETWYSSYMQYKELSKIK